MGILRRLFGGDRNGHTDHPASTVAPDGDVGLEASDADDAERARELELARFEQERADELVRRQQRYADRSWTPPRQGGERRAEDSDRPE